VTFHFNAEHALLSLPPSYPFWNLFRPRSAMFLMHLFSSCCLPSPPGRLLFPTLRSVCFSPLARAFCRSAMGSAFLFFFPRGEASLSRPDFSDPSLRDSDSRDPFPPPRHFLLSVESRLFFSCFFFLCGRFLQTAMFPAPPPPRLSLPVCSADAPPRVGALFPAVRKPKNFFSLRLF